MTKDDIAAFVKERDEALLSGDVDRCMAFHAKHNPDSIVPNNREIAEIGMHKARTAALSLPMSARVESRKWLSERGYKSLDGGTIQDS